MTSTHMATDAHAHAQPESLHTVSSRRDVLSALACALPTAKDLLNVRCTSRTLQSRSPPLTPSPPPPPRDFSSAFSRWAREHSPRAFAEGIRRGTRGARQSRHIVAGLCCGCSVRPALGGSYSNWFATSARVHWTFTSSPKRLER